MTKTSFRHTVYLFITSIIFGFSFVSQMVGMNYVGPFTFNGVRMLLGGLSLVPVLFLFRRRGVQRSETSQAAFPTAQKKSLLIGGLSCGLVLFLASSLQQVGMQYSTVGKAGFITAFYLVLVPVAGIFLHKKVPLVIWISVLMAFFGLYLISINESLTIGKGELLIFLCAIAYTAHILLIDHFSPKVNGIGLSSLQFFVCGLLSLPFMLGLETPTLSGLWEARIPILYSGVITCGVAYTLQVLGQKEVDPTIASLILSLESGISVLAGWLFLGEVMSRREALGCVLMFAAIILSQLVQSEQFSHLSLKISGKPKN